MAHIIALEHAKPVAEGHKRLVYQHPHDDDLLIKIMRVEFAAPRWGDGAGWRRRRAGILLWFTREVGEYLCVRARLAGPPPFLQRIEGFVETDLGLGLVVEKLRAADGTLAPPLSSLVRAQGFTGALQQELEQLLDAVVAHDVALGKLNAKNILRVWGGAGTRMVLIDGLGSKLMIPIDQLSRHVNRLTLRRRIRRLRAEIARLDAASRTGR